MVGFNGNEAVAIFRTSVGREKLFVYPSRAVALIRIY